MIRSQQLLKASRQMLELFGYNLEDVKDEFVFDLMREVSLLNTTTHKAMKNHYRQCIHTKLETLRSFDIVAKDTLINELKKLL